MGRISTAGGCAAAATSNFTLRPSLRERASIGIVQTRFSFAFLGFVEPIFRPSTSHQPSGAFALFVWPGRSCRR